MNIDYHFINDILVIDVPDGNGRLINNDLDEFITQLLQLCKGSTSEVAFNMGQKSYLNSSGLGELIKVKDTLLDKQIDLILINPTQRVESLINMVGVDQFFNIINSESDLG